MNYSTYNDMERIADELVKKMGKEGLKNIYFVACGGSLGGLAPMHCVIDSKAQKIHSDLITANEFVFATPKAVSESALVVAMSMSGNTPETCAAAEKARKHGATVVTFTHVAGSPLEQAGDFHVRYGFKDCPYGQTNNALLLRLGFELLRAFENYDEYQAALDAFEILDGICENAFSASAACAEKFAQQYRDQEQFYIVGSGGTNWVAYTTCICHLMEMEWMHCGYVNAGELFHGPLEVAQPDIAYLVFVNSGPTKEMDLRALRFLKTHTDRLVVIDAGEYGAEKFALSIRGLFESMVLSVVARQYTEALAREKKHPLGYRRYMFKVAY